MLPSPSPDGAPHRALAGRLEGCRKRGLIAKAAIGLGAIWLAPTVLGLAGFDGLQLSAAIAALIGGIVVFGSNAGTWREARAMMAAFEARRSALIDALDPHPVVPAPARRRLSHEM